MASITFPQSPSQSTTDLFTSPPEELANIYPALIDSIEVGIEPSTDDGEHTRFTATQVSLEALDLWTEPCDKTLDLPKPKHYLWMPECGISMPERAAPDDKALPAIPNSLNHLNIGRYCFCGKNRWSKKTGRHVCPKCNISQRGYILVCNACRTRTCGRCRWLDAKTSCLCGSKDWTRKAGLCLRCGRCRIRQSEYLWECNHCKAQRCTDCREKDAQARKTTSTILLPLQE